MPSALQPDLEDDVSRCFVTVDHRHALFTEQLRCCAFARRDASSQTYHSHACSSVTAERKLAALCSACQVLVS